jgi:hypothetical protein
VHVPEHYNSFRKERFLPTGKTITNMIFKADDNNDWTEELEAQYWAENNHEGT